jgi:ribosome-associated protein
MKKENKPVNSDLVDCITNAILDKKGNNVLSIRVGALPNAICEHFVICHADSTTQVSAIADSVEEQMILQNRQKPLNKNGHDNNIWVILDYAEVIVHIFQTEWRDYYKLEDLWADAPSTTYGEFELRSKMAI